MRSFALLAFVAVLCHCGGGSSPPAVASSSTSTSAPPAAATPAAAAATPPPVVAATPAPAGAAHYSMADLEALASRTGWTELLQHLGDIRPAERNDRWRALAEQAAIGAIDVYAREDDPRSAARLILDITKQYPEVAASPAFRAKRGPALLAGFDRCYERGWATNCTDRLWEATADTSDEGDFAFEAGRLVAKRDGKVAALRFFKRAVTGKKARERCDDDALMASMFAGLSSGAGPGANQDAKALRETCDGLRHR